MMHKKQHHKENIATCWNFACGNYEVGDKTCWFKQDIEDDPNPEEYKCKQCGKEFVTKSAFLKNKKINPSESVKKCRNQGNGKCIYQSENCWFIHEKQNSWMK